MSDEEIVQIIERQLKKSSYNPTVLMELFPQLTKRRVFRKTLPKEYTELFSQYVDKRLDHAKKAMQNVSDSEYVDTAAGFLKSVTDDMNKVGYTPNAEQKKRLREISKTASIKS